MALYDESNSRLGVISVWGIKGEVKAYQLGVGWPEYQLTINDIVIVKKQKSFKAGDIIVAFKDDLFLLLKATSENNKFIGSSKIYSQKELAIEGKVVQIIRNFEN